MDTETTVTTTSAAANMSRTVTSGVDRATAGPVAEASAPPQRPVIKRGDDSLTRGETTLLLSALATLLGVLVFVFTA